MPDITFIYKYNNNPEIYHGKAILNYLSDDHEGVDNELYFLVEKIINIYNIKNKLPTIQNLVIGVLSVIKNDYWCTDNEKNIFDIYIIEETKNKYYYNSVLLENINIYEQLEDLDSSMTNSNSDLEELMQKSLDLNSTPEEKENLLN